MLQVDTDEFQKCLPGYLKQVDDGTEIQISFQGRVVVRVVPVQKDADAARRRLESLRGSVIGGDVTSPLGDNDWTGDADHL
ncbi:MAG: type II toxin-antitoxin system prevent-host-death family antitoxin [Magnetococcales bacterium]|nr:type II toxin-antitoxin system prevent-host-death family antitoxin [Magnetococcales bacterium]